MNTYPKPKNDGSVVFGFIILGIGVLLLLRKLDIFYPDWLLSWPMILIVVGVFTLVKHEFKSFFGVVILAFGLYFLLEREFGFNFRMDRYIFPIALIILGVYLITQKKKEERVLRNIRDQVRARSTYTRTSPTDIPAGEPEDKEPLISNISGSNFSDQVNIDAILSGVNKRILSKNLKGGKLTAAFGGIDLDLTQADLSGIVTFQVDVIFGGTTLIVPPHWDVRTEVTNIAAGVEDKRMFRQSEVDPDKVLLIKGTIFFGGLEIKSY